MVRKKIKTTQINYIDTRSPESVSKGIQTYFLVGKHSIRSCQEELKALNPNYLLKDYSHSEEYKEMSLVDFYYNSKTVSSETTNK